MRITELGTAQKVPFNIDGRKMLVDSRVEIIHLTLQPGDVLEKHTNPFDVAIYVLEGSGVLESNDLSLAVSTNTCIEIEAGASMGVRNVDSNCMRLLVLKIFAVKSMG